MTAASAMKISKRQNEISNRLSNSHTTVKIKACKNGSGQFCMILVKKKLDNEYFLQVMEQIRHQLGTWFKNNLSDSTSRRLRLALLILCSSAPSRELAEWKELKVNI